MAILEHSRAKAASLSLRALQDYLRSCCDALLIGPMVNKSRDRDRKPHEQRERKERKWLGREVVFWPQI
jgi:hypothetical protein